MEQLTKKRLHETMIPSNHFGLTPSIKTTAATWSERTKNGA